MFEDFDFDILSTSDFKEDSVREELILPLLHRLGYSATGSNRITRSKALPHPYVMIGSKRKPITIIPDYLMSNENGYAFVLDAKAPSETIYRSDNVAQVYSYAIHPDVRVELYALCNGHELIVYEYRQVEPLIRVSLNEVEKHWAKLENILSPEAVAEPHKRDFLPDYGLAAYKAGYPKEIDWYWMDNHIDMIVKVHDDLYTLCSSIECEADALRYDPHIISFDASRRMLQDILQLALSETRSEILAELSRHPFRAELSTPLRVALRSHLGDLQRSEDEEFVPFVVTQVLPFVDTSLLCARKATS